MSAVGYAEDEWRLAVGHAPLSGLTIEDFALLHRHWIWANQMRSCFDQILAKEGAVEVSEGDHFLAKPGWGFMLVWYGLLWSVIEALVEASEGRSIDLRGRLRADIDSIKDNLRRCRNAVLHVPRSGDYFDDRLITLMSQPQSAATLRRVHAGLGRLFVEEARKRRPAPGGDAVQAG